MSAKRNAIQGILAGFSRRFLTDLFFTMKAPFNRHVGKKPPTITLS